MKRVLRVDVHVTDAGFSVEATDYDGRTVLTEHEGAYPDVESVAPAVKAAVDELVARGGA